MSLIEPGEVGRASHSMRSSQLSSRDAEERRVSFPDDESCTVVRRLGRNKVRTFPPVSPYQLLERVDTNIIGVHVLHLDIALLQVLLLDLVRVPRAAGEKQHYHQHRPVGVVWVRGRRICRRPDGLGLCAI